MDGGPRGSSSGPRSRRSSAGVSGVVCTGPSATPTTTVTAPDPRPSAVTEPQGRWDRCTTRGRMDSTSRRRHPPLADLRHTPRPPPVRRAGTRLSVRGSTPVTPTCASTGSSAVPSTPGVPSPPGPWSRGYGPVRHPFPSLSVVPSAPEARRQGPDELPVQPLDVAHHEGIQVPRPCVVGRCVGGLGV